MLEVSSERNVVVGLSQRVVITHSRTTRAVLWRAEMPGDVHTFRIHGGVVIIPINNSNTAVLDLTTGHQRYTLPSAGFHVRGLCVFVGLKSYVLLRC